MTSPQSLAAAAPLTTRRVMGIETEFGVAHADMDERARAGVTSAVLLSHLTIGAYALLDENEGERGHRVRWDYGDESPLRDARGFEVLRSAAHPTQLTHETHEAHLPSVDVDAPVQGPDVAPDGDDADVLAWASHRSIGNAVLTNGARWYVDHAHPEYCAPEVTRARDAVIQDRAGEVIARRAMARLDAADGIPAVALYKNNTDGKGSSYGTHENFLVDRAVPFERIVEALLPFFASRQILVGAGRVGIGRKGQQPGFQIAARSDFFEAEVGLETTLNRPIVNTRDEPHADHTRFRRLHVIIGDANLLEESTFLKLGTTSLVLAALEREQATGGQILPRIELEDPVAALHAISHDPALRTAVPLVDGEAMNALQIQRAYLEALVPFAADDDDETAQVLRAWGEILDLLEVDPLRAAHRVEWAAKLALLEKYRARYGLDWDDPRLAAIDLQWADLRPSSGLFPRLVRTGAAPTLVTEGDVAAALTTPPADTRAHLRGSLIREHRRSVPSAGWDVLTLQSDSETVRVRLADPELGSAAWCERNGVDPSAPIPEILSALRAAGTRET